MTQPVQEPTEQRQLAAADYRTRQLARRPAIVNAFDAGQMALAYALGSSQDQVIADGFANWQRIGGPLEDEWVDGYTNPAAEVILEGAGSQQMLTPDLDRGSILLRTGTGPLPVFQIAIRCFFFTAAGWAGQTGIRLNTDSITVIPLDMEPESIQPAPLDPGTYALFLSHGPMICSGPSAGATPVEFFIRVFQDSGGDLDFFDPQIVIQQLGWFDADEGTFYPVST